MKVEKDFTYDGVISDAISHGYSYEEFESDDDEIVVRVTETPFDAVEYVFSADKKKFLGKYEDSVDFSKLFGDK